MSETTLLVVLVLATVLLFLSMILSAMASSAAADCTNDDAHKYSMYSAVLCGISAVLMTICIGIYYYRDEIRTHVGKAVKKVGKHIKGKKV
jgi:uncharacterized membrane protein YjgN (DUF898 family)